LQLAVLKKLNMETIEKMQSNKVKSSIMKGVLQQEKNKGEQCNKKTIGDLQAKIDKLWYPNYGEQGAGLVLRTSPRIHSNRATPAMYIGTALFHGAISLCFCK
jgi:hypothetical protein